MIGFILFVVVFHLNLYWLFRVYTKTKQIDYKNPTEFESMVFWPFILLNLKQSKLKKYND